MKNQLKKSLSLFLAVLMLLSCWVWVAPEKAEAATTTQYYVKFTSNVTDTGDENSGTKLTIDWKNTNGTSSGTTGSKVVTFSQQSWDGQTTIWEGMIDGFPTKVTFNLYLDSTRSERHENFCLYVGSSAETCTTNVISSDSYTFKGSSNTFSKSVNSSTYPKFTSVSSVAGIEAGTLNKLANGATITKTAAITGAKDQYGVAWAASYPTSGFSYALKNGEGGAISSTYASVSGSGSTATVKLNDDLQKLFPNTKSGTIYLHATYGGVTVTSNVKFDNPEYTMTFDANGGKIGADDSTAADTVPVGGTDSKLFYDAVIGKAPAYRVKPGFEFKGFYSSKNADAPGKTASFSGTLFEDGVTKVDANGDKTWYAAWQARPITATFVTADNQLIGTVEGRYANYLTASNMYNGDTGLNAAVKEAYKGSTIKFNETDYSPIYKDGSTNYTFAGWKIIRAYDESVVDGNEDTKLYGDVTFQAVYTKANAATYTVNFKNAEGSVISTKSGYKYRDEVTNVPATEPTKAQDDRYDYKFIGWAKDIGKNFYTVDEADKDENGATIAYTSKESAEFIVKGDASYVPVFRMIPREYTVTFNYTIDGGATESVTVDGYHWADGITMPEAIKNNYTNGGFRYYIDGWKIGTDSTKKQLDDISVNGNLTLTATYGAGEAAEYTINFYGKDTDGITDVHLNPDANIYAHGSSVTAPAVPQKIDTDDSLYTFAGWSPEVKAEANGDVEYYATYTKKDYADLHFYNYDGTLIYEKDGKENSLFVGETIPEYQNLVDGVNVLPAKAEDVVGTYNFTGWADDNGNEVVPGTDKFAGNTFLYAQFETDYKEYPVKFVNEGTTVSEKNYKYGEEITVPADPTKAADVEYTYKFKYWSPDVSDICYGAATYTAVYERNPQYYKVTWLRDDKTVLSESNYKYNQKIQQAVVNSPVSYDPAGEGKTWAFKHWVQCDENGNDVLVNGEQVIFIRGMKMGDKHLYFYPVFEKADNVLTVTFYKEDGTTLLGEAKIPYGRDINEFAEEFAKKAPKAPDADYHYVINEWKNIENDTVVTTVTADVSVKATYTATAHDKKLYEIVAEPTANVPGYGHYKCEADECTAIDYYVAIAPVADEAAPTGQIYVGTNKWTFENFAAGIDYGDIKFVGPDTYLVVNAKDKGSVSEPWNSDGSISRGVGKIEYYVANGKVNDVSSITNWTEVYNIESMKQEVLNTVLAENKLTLVDYNGYIRGTAEEQAKKAEIDRAVDAILAGYNANATGIVSNLNLVNGNNYVIYIRVSDREGLGEVNTCIYSSGTISYGSTAPTITVTGEGYGTKFCADATIAVTDDTDGFKTYIDGVEVTLTEGKLAYNTKGVHTVTVVDKHGNKTTKTFEIKGNHTYRNYTIAATCENAGSRYDICTLCDHKANEEILPAFGHKFLNYVDKAPDCINDGYRTYVCDNNCGETLVLKPTDDAATVAQAKKWDEKAGEEGEWVDLTVADLAGLIATGEHTYAFVKDENGEDTDVEAWVIDKAATCIVEGSKHRDCTVCGIIGRETAVIPVDTKDGHKFYREKITKEATCTEAGLKTKTCRYCGHVEKVEDIPAFGHTAGEYKTTLAPTCTDKGSKILYCAICDVAIGEPIKDADGKVTGFDGKAVEIDALDHAWKFDGDVYEEDGKYWQNSVCKNDSTHTKREEVADYKPPVAATITFDFNGGSYTVPAVGNPNELGYVPEMLKGTQTVNAYVGESIAASDVETAFKQANKTKTFSFSYWATKNADGTYTEVKFPIEVKGDATYYAVYAEKYINYTITYYKENNIIDAYKKTGYLHNGEEVTLIDGPSKAGTTLVEYKFAGWKVIGSSPEVKYTDKVTINGADIELEATYTVVKKQYAVTYAYSKSDILETFNVVAGQPARDCTIEPEKKFDTKYHYEFKEWNKASQLVSVESNIYTTPNFDSISHEYTETVKTPAACGVNKVVIKTCSCGYSYEEEVAGSALEHLWGDPVYDETTGKNTVTCTRENCGASEQDTRTFTAKFYVSADAEQPIKTIYYIAWGAIIDTIKLPADPVKDATSSTEYKFKGWALKDDTTEALVDFAKLEVKKDYEFVAVFEKITRKYNVIFLRDGDNVIKSYTDVPAGTDIETEFTEADTPVKAYDMNNHYTFSGWKGYDEGELNIKVENVQSNLKIYAEFSKEKHEYDNETKLENATCQNGEGTRYSCDCGAYYDVTGKPLDHTWVEIEKVEATEGNDGYIKYECSGCGETKTDVLTWVSDKIILEVKVLCNGEPQANVAVQFVEKTASAVPFPATTGIDGIARVQTTISDDGYACYVSIDGEMVLVENFAEGANGNYSGTYSYTTADEDCSCACHRNNFWGTIFRFFHKIIKLFTGEFKCCGNPDPMYG